MKFVDILHNITLRLGFVLITLFLPNGSRLRASSQIQHLECRRMRMIFDYIAIDRLQFSPSLRVIFFKLINGETLLMALNPQLFPNGMPVPFVNEMFVLARDGVEFEIDKIPGTHGDHVKAKGTIYLSNIRMVFVANKPVGNFAAFDIPLLYVHGEKFNQPIFHCNNIAGHVDPVVPDNEHRALYSTHSFKILSKEGGCGTFVPLFFNLISSVRQYNQRTSMEAQPQMDPLQAASTPVDEMMRHAYVDPNDPTRIFLQQPTQESQLRRRTYNPHAVESSI
ncbi:Hypothetical predicted protein [Olea europaea subsp. europaea]|uniref:Uncharacterized protein n=2 Tax=Olea europaea subsp. europaea TaxID=158383 RepID=A0A8S0SS77_OLEEU|nr:Hypothetical predicted protein [Olea europaea subsp. europaea]